MFRFQVLLDSLKFGDSNSTQAREMLCSVRFDIFLPASNNRRYIPRDPPLYSQFTRNTTAFEGQQYINGVAQWVCPGAFPASARMVVDSIPTKGNCCPTHLLAKLPLVAECRSHFIYIKTKTRT